MSHHRSAVSRPRCTLGITPSMKCARVTCRRCVGRKGDREVIAHQNCHWPDHPRRDMPPQGSNKSARSLLLVISILALQETKTHVTLPESRVKVAARTPPPPANLGLGPEGGIKIKQANSSLPRAVGQGSRLLSESHRPSLWLRIETRSVRLLTSFPQ